MEMLRVVGVIALLVCLLASCHRSTAKILKETVAMADADAAHQLVSGFYPLENNSWRWTARQFVVTFPGSAEHDNGKLYTLRLDLFVPEIQLKNLGPLTLQADVNGTILREETFREPGAHSYIRQVPAGALQSNILPVVFFLDKASVPASSDGRELGLVVNAAQLSVN